MYKPRLKLYTSVVCDRIYVLKILTIIERLMTVFVAITRDKFDTTSTAILF